MLVACINMVPYIVVPLGPVRPVCKALGWTVSRVMDHGSVASEAGLQSSNYPPC
jgi:hypothetical protein